MHGGKPGVQALLERVENSLNGAFEDARGQFVFDVDGNRVGGIWYIPRDECPQSAPEPPIVTRDGEPE
jgi:hypothetical protein